MKTLSSLCEVRWRPRRQNRNVFHSAAFRTLGSGCLDPLRSLIWDAESVFSCGSLCFRLNTLRKNSNLVLRAARWFITTRHVAQFGVLECYFLVVIVCHLSFLVYWSQFALSSPSHSVSQRFVSWTFGFSLRTDTWFWLLSWALWNLHQAAWGPESAASAPRDLEHEPGSVTLFPPGLILCCNNPYPLS